MRFEQRILDRLEENLRLLELLPDNNQPDSCMQNQSVLDTLIECWYDPDPRFVDTSVRLILGRPSDDRDLERFIPNLLIGMPRAELIRFLCHSPESRFDPLRCDWVEQVLRLDVSEPLHRIDWLLGADSFAEFIVRCYRRLLGRTPRPDEVNYWKRRMRWVWVSRRVKLIRILERSRERTLILSRAQQDHDRQKLVAVMTRLDGVESGIRQGTQVVQQLKTQLDRLEAKLQRMKPTTSRVESSSRVDNRSESRSSDRWPIARTIADAARAGCLPHPIRVFHDLTDDSTLLEMLQSLGLEIVSSGRDDRDEGWITPQSISLLLLPTDSEWIHSITFVLKLARWLHLEGTVAIVDATAESDLNALAQSLHCRTSIRCQLPSGTLFLLSRLSRRDWEENLPNQLEHRIESIEFDPTRSLNLGEGLKCAS